MEPDNKAAGIIKAFDSGMAAMASWRSVVKSTARYFRPEYEDLESPQSEGSSVALANTSVGIDAMNKMAAGIYSNTLSMGKGILEPVDPVLRDSEIPKRFCGVLSDQCTDQVRTVLPGPYRQMVDDYCHTSVGVVFCAFDEVKKTHTITAFNPGDCVWFEDVDGNPHKMYRGFEFTADQAVERFGYDAVGDEVRMSYDDPSKCNDKFKYIHYVGPRRKRDENKKDLLNLPYEDIYVEVKSVRIVQEGGFHAFRYIVPVMFKRRGQRVGMSPAMHALPSMRTLVRGVDDFLDAVEFKSKPALMMSDRDSINGVKNNLVPGAVLYAKLSDSPFLYGTEGDPGPINDVNEQMRIEIRDAFFLGLFNALEEFKQGQRTAYEIAQIIAEKIHLIAPIISPLKDQFFAPLFGLIAGDLIRSGAVSEPMPQEMEGIDRFDVRYISRIDSRMGGMETENLLFALQEMAQVEQLMQAPSVAAFSKVYEMLSDIANKRNLNPKLVQDRQGYEDNVAAAQQAQAQAMQMQADAAAAGKRNLNQAPEPGSEADVVARAKMEAMP